jgi:hypothetical protein
MENYAPPVLKSRVDDIDNEVEEFRRRLELSPTKEAKLKANLSHEWVKNLRLRLSKA